MTYSLKWKCDGGCGKTLIEGSQQDNSHGIPNPEATINELLDLSFDEINGFYTIPYRRKEGSGHVCEECFRTQVTRRMLENIFKEVEANIENAQTKNDKNGLNIWVNIV